MLVLGIVLLFLFWIDAHLIIKNVVVNYNRLHLPFYIKIGYCIVLTLHSLKTSFFQKLNANVVKLSSSKYLLSYVIAGKLYKAHIPLKRGPTKILQILDIDAADITSQVEPFFGPDESFRHIQQLKPVDLGHEELTFNLSDGSVVRFKAGDVLTI